MDASLEHGHAEAGASHVSHVDDDQKVRIGMFLYVVTDILFALFLLISYLFLRANNTQGAWFPAGVPTLGGVQGIALLEAILLVVSGIAFIVAHVGVRGDNQTLTRIGVVIAALGWLVALIVQFYFAGHLPFVTTNGAFASIYITLTGYHLYHLLFAAPMMIGLTVRSLQGRYTAARHLGITTVGYFWYWAVILGIIIWLLPIVLPPQL